MVLRRNTVLLVRRGRPPGRGDWALPGGAQELGETAEAAARRELQEETGLSVGPLTLVAHVDSIHRDAGNRVRYHYTILDFAALWAGGEPVAGADAAAAGFFADDTQEFRGLWTEAQRVIGLARAQLAIS